MSALVQRGIAQGRPMALAVTIALHVALVAGLLAIKVVEAVKERVTPIQLQPIEEKPRPIPVVEPIRPVLGRPVALVPQTPPDLQTLAPDDTITAVIADPPVDAVPQQSVGDPGRSTVAAPDTPLSYRAIRSPDEYYPPQAIRMAAEGAVIVRACVDSGGRLSGAPAVVRTSGESLLDAAALKWAGESLRFQAATRAGVPVASCKEFRVTFRLR